MFLKIVLSILFSATAVSAMSCFTCENDKCAYDYGYVKVDCGPQIYQCYSLKNLDKKTYSAGCLARNCEEIRRSGGQSCDACDSELCNGPVQGSGNYPKIGSGTTFNSCSSHPFSLFFVTLFLVLFLFY